MPFTLFDVVLVVVMLISGFLAMLRGLTREVLSILSWAAAAIAALYAYRNYQDVARQYISHPQLADIVLVATTFVVVLVIVSLITMKIGDKVLDSRVGALDRSLGFLFGLARGLILIVILYLFYSWFFTKETQPPEILNARTLPLVERTGQIIKDLAEKATGWFAKEMEENKEEQDDGTDKEDERSHLLFPSDRVSQEVALSRSQPWPATRAGAARWQSQPVSLMRTWETALISPTLNQRETPEGS